MSIFDKNETGCKASDKCFSHTKRLMNNQTESQKTRLLFPHKRKRRQECFGCCEMYHNWVVSRKTRSHWILKEANSPRETQCNKIWDQFDEYDSQSTLHQACIRENEGPSHGKKQVKHPRQRNPHAMKFEDRSQEETERQQ